MLLFTVSVCLHLLSPVQQCLVELPLGLCSCKIICAGLIYSELAVLEALELLAVCVCVCVCACMCVRVCVCVCVF